MSRPSAAGHGEAECKPCFPTWTPAECSVPPEAWTSPLCRWSSTTTPLGSPRSTSIGSVAQPVQVSRARLGGPAAVRDTGEQGLSPRRKDSVGPPCQCPGLRSRSDLTELLTQDPGMYLQPGDWTCHPAPVGFGKSERDLVLITRTEMPAAVGHAPCQPRSASALVTTEDRQ